MGILNTLTAAIASAAAGALVSWVISFLQGEKLIKKLEWSALALSESSTSKHAIAMQSVRNQAEAGLLASHFAPKTSYRAAVLFAIAMSAILGLRTDEPIHFQLINDAIFVMGIIFVSFYAHKKFCKHRAVRLYFLNNSIDKVLAIDEQDYKEILDTKAILNILSLAASGVAITFISYSAWSQEPVPAWTILVLGLSLYLFVTGFLESRFVADRIARRWCDKLAEQDNGSE